MRLLGYILLVLLPTLGLCQSSDLLIARNTGTKTLHDGVEIRSFGFAQKLSENPGMPGPTLVYSEGDSVTIDLWNVSQGAPHTIHLHGLDVNQENDGVPHLSFDVGHMKHGYYKFIAPHPGTYLYHCHVVSAIHVQAGMYGLLIVKPKSDENTTWEGGYSFVNDYSFMTAEVDTFWHKDSVLLHDTSAMHIPVPPFNPTYFLVNGLSKNQLRQQSYAILKDEKTFLRFANIGYTGNRIKFPSSLNAQMVSSDGRPLPTVATQDTLNVYPGERYGVLVEGSTLELDSIELIYFDLNNQNVLGEENIQIETVAELNLSEIQSKSVSVYPNPATSFLNVELPPDQISVISIYDVLGKEMEIKRFDGRIDISSLKPGTYRLRAELKSGKLVSEGFVKQ
jgi:hypothetical protein